MPLLKYYESDQNRGSGSAESAPAQVEIPAALRDALLDPAVWEEGLEKYAVAMKLGVAIADADGRLLGRCLNPQPTWSLIHRKQAASAGACPFDLGGQPPCSCVADALKHGTVVMARDRTGLVHFAAPLVLGEHRLGALLAGQVFDRYPEQLPLELVAKRCGLYPEKVVQMACREQPVSQATLRVYAELLAILGKSFLQTRYATLREAERAAELTRLHDQLHQAQKMETVGRLAGGVAHNFNNLMTPVLGYCDILLGQLAPGDPTRTSIEVIQQCAKRASEVTRQLQAFSRNQMFAPKVLDLNAVVSETDRLLTRLLGEDIERVCDLDPTLGRVNADPRQMEQALLNLVINARDAMPAGGRLTIASRNVAVDEAFANENPDIPPGDYIMLSVTDTGYGMDDQVKSHLFEPFFTTKEESKGTGLGLAIVYGFIAQSGGHLRVQSKPGCGSTFKIYLPRVDDGSLRPTSVRLPSVRPTAVRLAALGPAAPAGTSNAVRGTETVLLVEDDEAIGALGKLVLQTIGYTVLQAGDGLQALQISEQHPGTIHLLVTDVVMPNMSGRQLAQRLVQARPALKVLFMSGHPNEIILEDSAPSARTDFLPKPFTLVALENTVRAVLDG